MVATLNLFSFVGEAETLSLATILPIDKAQPRVSNMQYPIASTAAMYTFLVLVLSIGARSSPIRPKPTPPFLLGEESLGVQDFFFLADSPQEG